MANLCTSEIRFTSESNNLKAVEDYLNLKVPLNVFNTIYRENDTLILFTLTKHTPPECIIEKAIDIAISYGVTNIVWDYYIEEECHVKKELRNRIMTTVYKEPYRPDIEFEFEMFFHKIDKFEFNPFAFDIEERNGMIGITDKVYGVTLENYIKGVVKTMFTPFNFLHVEKIVKDLEDKGEFIYEFEKDKFIKMKINKKGA